MIPTRERCQMCHKCSPIGFWVPDEVWQAAVHPHWQNSILCVNCFIEGADERLIPWDKYIEFLPVSRRTHMSEVRGFPLDAEWRDPDWISTQSEGSAE